MSKFAELHEELVSMVEKTIDSKFRDAIKRAEQDRLAKINNALNDPDISDYRRGELEKGKKQKDPVKLIYKAMASRGLDVEASTIEFIGTGADLDAKKLKNILKAKMDKVDYNNGPNRVLLILDQERKASSWNPEDTRDGGFSVWVAEYHDGKFYLDDWNPEGFSGYAKGRVLMADLNAKNKWLADKDFYIAYGKSLYDKRDERRKAKGPDNLNRYTKTNNYWGDFDKSGYDLKAARNALQMRLKDYKKNNGTYTKQVEDLTKQLDELLPQVKEILSNVDFNQGIEKPQNVMKAARKAAVAIKDITSSADSQWYDDSSMKRRIDDAKEALDNLKNIL